jgi:hypothetical protein
MVQAHDDTTSGRHAKAHLSAKLRSTSACSQCPRQRSPEQQTTAGDLRRAARMVDAAGALVRQMHLWNVALFLPRVTLHSAPVHVPRERTPTIAGIASGKCNQVHTAAEKCGSYGLHRRADRQVCRSRSRLLRASRRRIQAQRSTRVRLWPLADAGSRKREVGL